jgi:hypothetical protein
MSQNDNQIRRITWVLLILVAVITLYVLSIGPASRLMGQLNPTQHYEAMERIIWLYRPITDLGDHCWPVQRLVDWYCWLWG